MTPDKKDLYALGYFTKLHGYKGELTAFLDSTQLRDYENLEHIFVDVNGELVPYIVSLIEFKTNTSMKVKLEGVDTEEKAKALVKSSIYIQPDQVSENDEARNSMRAIAGFKVIDEEKGMIGTVNRIEELQNNPLLVINAGKKEILLPLNGDFFQKIDRVKKEVYIAAPAGLIDFYLEQA